MTVLAALAVAMAFMLGELWLSKRHERALLVRGAVAAADPVYGAMRWAYPAAFVAMAVEGFLRGSPRFAVAGAVLFVAAKLLKFWAIASLGERWTFKVFVLPDAPLVASGPYRFMRHPNYVGVIGELAAMAMLTGARVAGPLAFVSFSWLLLRRITAEEKALRIG